ncbi:hypothetical protein T459_30941 [Capsicum annuum]|uniref:Leucine-rich repeat-containing N-terminal plant-type domain-containing protein n=1 Tax=Capsicum annuum TaxID=4072 RepID=A0A2G2Y9S1_CAPAN|nr:hypothetical protein T459_30941 [Capsicum annuum]
MVYNQFSFLLFLYFCLLSFTSSIPHPCHKDQSISLQKFKHTFTIDPSASHYCPLFHPKTSLWNVNRDCCSWDGVTCDEMTDHVIELDLSCSQLVGKIDSNSSLFQLSHLQRLDLTHNNFSNSHISPEFGRFSNLTHLDLSVSSFSGQIPSQLSYLLQSLRLNPSSETNLRLAAHDFELLLQNLTQLTELDLTGINISSTIPLNFSSHLTSLRFLYLSNCNFRGPIPESLSNLTCLEYLFLDVNTLNGTIPSGIFSLPSVIDLVLSNNHFSGQLEDFKSNSLRWIDLRNNQLQGHLPNSIQNVVNQTWLHLSFNNFCGHMDVSLFSDLKHLWRLDLSYNSISLTNENKVNVTWPESLDTLLLAACDVKELEVLRSAKHLRDLALSNNKLQGRIPDWAWSNWMFSLQHLNLSHNMLTSVNSIPLQYVYTIDLRSNVLQGSLPIPPNTTWFFFVSQNNLSGEIPSSICNTTSLIMLDLARNNLHGEIPQCLGKITALEVLDMCRNNLSGNLPTTFSSGSSLRSLNLHGNKLEGKIPRSLANCKELQVLDLGDNHLIDKFPMWLGTLPKLQVLRLRSNELYGSIQPSTIETIFPELRIIDLSYNAFSGNLPTSLFQHLKAMRTIDPSIEAPRYDDARYYQDSITVATKGLEHEILRILYLHTVIDLSANKLGGQLPSIMGNFIELDILNLSHNGLQGYIPPSFGDLSSVESLDLSGNQLTGEIPQQLVCLTSLSFLNLSHNHFRGCIPQGPQSHTFDNNSYEGNDGLHGFPVSKSCGNDQALDTHFIISGLDD